MIKVKICGMTGGEDVRRACEYGADLVGFIFAEVSPRAVTAAAAKKLIRNVSPNTGKAGLFKDEDIEEVKRCVLSCGLDYVQLHGSESPGYCGELKETLLREGAVIGIIKTFKVKDSILGVPPAEYIHVDYYLFDTYHPKMMGGTGTTFDWSVLKDLKSDRPFFLAGGLTPQNVAAAVKTVRPYGVDVASGVEISPGKKDGEKVKEFIRNARNA